MIITNEIEQLIETAKKQRVAAELSDQYYFKNAHYNLVRATEAKREALQWILKKHPVLDRADELLEMVRAVANRYDCTDHADDFENNADGCDFCLHMVKAQALIAEIEGKK